MGSFKDYFERRYFFMKKMRQLFADSLRELQDVRKLSVMAMMLARAVVLGFYAHVQVTSLIHI